NALSFITIIVALWRWQPSAAQSRGNAQGSFMDSIRSGLVHAVDNRQLRNTLLRSVAFYLFASAYWALLPLVARQQLHGDAQLFGILVGGIGAGAVAGSLWLQRLRLRFGLDGTLIAGTVATALAMTGYALLRMPLLGVLASLVAGAAWITSLSSLN